MDADADFGDSAIDLPGLRSGELKMKFIIFNSDLANFPSKSMYTAHFRNSHKDNNSKFPAQCFY